MTASVLLLKHEPNQPKVQKNAYFHTHTHNQQTSGVIPFVKLQNDT